MKKKNLFVILSVLTLYSTALAGCSESSERSDMTAETAAVNNYVPTASDTTVTGEVTKITGNRITLALGNITEDSSAPDENSCNAPEADGNMPDFGGEKPDMNGNMPDFGGEMPDMNGDMPDFGGEMPDMNGTPPDMGNMPSGKGGRKSASVEKTGEEAEYILPVGMPIDGLSGRSNDYSGVSAGDVITLTVNDRGNVCAAEVS